MKAELLGDPRYQVLAFDYDGTLAMDGVVAPSTVEILRRLKAAAYTLVLVTGRRTEDLLEIFPQAELFELIVAENGGVVYRPGTDQYRVLGAPPPDRFIAGLRERGVVPLELGRVIVATRQPQETIVLELIRELGLELQLIFNKGAVMVLPPNVNKATGLGTALTTLNRALEQVIGVGDAENDHAFLDACGLSVAVANAVPALKQHADLVLGSADGAGVCELGERLLACKPSQPAQPGNRGGSVPKSQ